jgi:protein-L-isoaspartate(D-aspartate) O-methyltransferase
MTEARARMVEGLRREIRDERVLRAFAEVPRERFVPAEFQAYAYEDRPLGIGHGQTISQPMMVALMLQEMALTGNEKVLDVGTGSGYQAALLSRMAAQVVGVELVHELAENARRGAVRRHRGCRRIAARAPVVGGPTRARGTPGAAGWASRASGPRGRCEHA